jgi:ArsR family transcriptional regulator
MLSGMKATAQFFKALSDETRLRILALLTNGELCVCDLMAVLDLPQSTVSRHLAYLRHAGLVEDRRRGVWMYYRLAVPDAELHDLAHQLPQRLTELERGRHDQTLLRDYLTRKASSACE